MKPCGDFPKTGVVGWRNSSGILFTGMGTIKDSPVFEKSVRLKRFFHDAAHQSRKATNPPNP